MLRLLMLFIAFVNVPRCGAQGENNIWIIPHNIRLDFNGAAARPSENISLSGSASAAICDRDGRLLFFSDGCRVWDRNQAPMPNGTFQVISPYYARTALIIPFPGEPDKYYLFTINPDLCYSVIDMTLNGGLGDVIPDRKMVLLAEHMSDKIIAVRGDGCYVWLLAHLTGKNEFLAFRIDKSGISASPVHSVSGFFNGLYSYSVGNMAIGRDNRTLAVGSQEDIALELHTFDNATGIVSNAFLADRFSSAGRVHSVCISPDNSKVYLTGGPGGSDLVQYDISGFPGSGIVKAVIVDYERDRGVYLNGELRLGPDNRIYAATFEGVYCIRYPDRPGLACGFSDACISLPAGAMPRPYSLGTDSKIAGYKITTVSRDTYCCEALPVSLAAPPGFRSYVWKDGSRMPSVSVTGREPLYWVVSETGCETRVDTFRITYVPCNCNISAPNAFSPNGDGLNDLFRLVSPDMETITLMIYNRYGQPVFTTTEPGAGWDGNMKGTPAGTGSYFYYAAVRCFSGREKVVKGSFMLLR